MPAITITKHAKGATSCCHSHKPVREVKKTPQSWGHVLLNFPHFRVGPWAFQGQEATTTCSPNIVALSTDWSPMSNSQPD
eukprot:4322138-Amphidinium_carterae.1